MASVLTAGCSTFGADRATAFAGVRSSGAVNSAGFPSRAEAKLAANAERELPIRRPTAPPLAGCSGVGGGAPTVGRLLVGSGLSACVLAALADPLEIVARSSAAVLLADSVRIWLYLHKHPTLPISKLVPAAARYGRTPVRQRQRARVYLTLPGP